MRGSARLLVGVAVLAMTNVGNPLQAQTVPGTPAIGADTQGGVQDIIVTAQRRSESLQRVPVAVSAVTADSLQASGVTGLSNIQMAVPSLNVQNGNGYLALHLRGIGSLANGPGFENPVALYIDGVYYGNQSVGLAPFNNIERIEVLKGPQGTLFGRNATGGLVHIITKDPGQTTEVKGALSYGNFNDVQASVYAGGPVTSNLGADFGIHFGRRDGYGTNLFNGKDVNGVGHDIAVRSKIVWSPGDFKFTLIGDYADRVEDTNALGTVEGSRLAPGAPPVRFPDRWDINSDAQPRLHINGGGVSLKSEIGLGAISLSNLAAYREARFRNNFDYDGSPLPITAVFIDQKDWQFSDELQISSGSGGAFTWVAGAFYYRAAGEMAPGTNVHLGFPVSLDIPINGTQDTESVSGYVQGTLNLTDQLRVTGGARYTWEKRELTTPPIAGGIYQARTFKRPSFRAAVDYTPLDRVMFYASVNTGFKSGGFNVTQPTSPAYLPEKITAYEVGQKADLFDRVLRLNTALFYYDYTDIQVQVAGLASTGFTNGASAEIYGADVDITLAPVRGLEITGSASWLHATFKDFTNAPIGTAGGGSPVVTGDASGNRLAYAPKFVSNVSATYTVPIQGNDLALSGSWLHSGSYFHEADNVVREPSYNLLSASITYNFADRRYSIGVFGNNLTNEAIHAVVLTIPSGQQAAIMQAPRTYGVKFGFNF